MLSVVSNVQYNTIAREWRCKWDSDESLIESQNALADVLEKVKSVDGVRDVQRVVCGGCKDFKVSMVVQSTSASFDDGTEGAFSIFWMRPILVSYHETSHPMDNYNYSFDHSHTGHRLFRRINIC
jgi:hypothetical protein